MIVGSSKKNNGQGRGPLRQILLYISLLLAGWILLMFLVIPWDTSGTLPRESFTLIEGQRAYAMLLRKERPTLATVIRGLNMVGAKFTQHPGEDGRSVVSGNVRIWFDMKGEFLHLDILKEPQTAQK